MSNTLIQTNLAGITQLLANDILLNGGSNSLGVLDEEHFTKGTFFEKPKV